MSKAVVVAHPDDETLWASSHIGPGVDVICCTVPRRDPERAIRFFDAVRELGGFPILIPFVESAPNELLPHLDVLDLSRYDTVVTHGAKGEYGHLHHMHVHDHVNATFTGKKVFFGYQEGNLVECDPERKKAALMKYDHHSPSDGGKPKWQALIDVYDIDLGKEYFQC